MRLRKRDNELDRNRTFVSSISIRCLMGDEGERHGQIMEAFDDAAVRLPAALHLPPAQ
jgi:hypothetical protein